MPENRSTGWVVCLDDSIPHVEADFYITYDGNGDNDHCVTVYLPEPVEESVERLATILNEHWPRGDRVRTQPVLVAQKVPHHGD